MTANDALSLLRQKDQQYGKGGRTRIARELGYSPTVVTQMLSEPISYTGNIDNVVQRIIEVYGGLSVQCPIMGEIPLAQCSTEQKKPFRSTNEQAVQLFLACKTCERRK